MLCFADTKHLDVYAIHTAVTNRVLFTIGSSSKSYTKRTSFYNKFLKCKLNFKFLKHFSAAKKSSDFKCASRSATLVSMLLTSRENEASASLKSSFSDENNLLNKNSAGRLSLLESIDNMSYRTISFGFPLLTIGIVAGAVWANEAWGSYWSWDPKETWALITWLVFASYLHTRITKNLQGEKPALIAALGFIVVWICYLGVNFLGKGLHTYGQIL